ncbi:MAG TPA: L,D-transpeptidase family protein [Bacillus sp. (in: firmicutes)]|uniref:L,D-transpeptidase family protein n=1 Tax=Bacillus litorisediminis TaxID=2922713 RepID=UPI001FAC0B59|nr:L,D-transpeptidase family protein [Bacillus litorisediminis]HWO78693.1 L,D-transpeptidase family protein [Bacillus sp. (in: firmicutes)]
MKIKIVAAGIIFLMIMLFYATSFQAAEKREMVEIKVNLWSNELFVIQNNQVIRRYPISSGTEENPTPIGIFKVTEKSQSWGGGFGTRWLGLDVPWGQYGIHGTNKPQLIGKNVSSGCIRMRNEDVEDLFTIIPEGTVVRIYGPVTGRGKGEYRNLSLGSKGNLVVLVQERLKGLGFYYGRVDGIYDEETQKAVKRFQKKNRLPITGGIMIREYILLGLLE